MEKVIGKVSATEKCPSTIDDFFFWTDKKQILSPFDIVKVEHEDNSITYAVIEEINHVTDAASHFTSYISSDLVVIEWFKAITAPCYIGFEEATKNYIDFSHVEIIEKSNSLELSLYANAYNYSKLTTDDSDESTPDLFSKAVIYKSSIPSENSIVNLDFYKHIKGWDSNRFHPFIIYTTFAHYTI